MSQNTSYWHRGVRWLHVASAQWQCQNSENYLQVRRTSCIWALRPFQMFTGPLLEIKLHWLVLPYSVDFKAPRQYLVNFTGLAGIVNATVHKTEPIFIDLEHGKSYWSLTLQWCKWSNRNVHLLVSHTTYWCPYSAKNQMMQLALRLLLDSVISRPFCWRHLIHNIGYME